jgi:hypothetical protein
VDAAARIGLDSPSPIRQADGWSAHDVTTSTVDDLRAKIREVND